MSTYQKYLDTYTRGFMGFNTLAVLLQSGLGGFAAMLILQHGNSVAQMVQLFFVVITCSVFNGTVLAQMKPQVVFNTLLLSIAVSITAIITNIFFIG
ncbi:hypothetical protein [Flavobacterium sp. AG291]|uniref:hypothetical protein n=1 Tax=Flavobacterium sp. AG291 TaxID=2184000 RepID=UPI000E0A0509|nr:hypothetical protein [Flavobacterium sp. AG291]RDI08544.1 hypothetical protein DEU42_11075 [Flavobacterium sp. AG291]